ncbi:MAG: hypothetical protein RQ714_05005 [Nitrosomonas sp.]|nr:hypothetical protein [Nitrosomonas sp.]
MKRPSHSLAKRFRLKFPTAAVYDHLEESENEPDDYQDENDIAENGAATAGSSKDAENAADTPADRLISGENCPETDTIQPDCRDSDENEAVAAVTTEHEPMEDSQENSMITRPNGSGE